MEKLSRWFRRFLILKIIVVLISTNAISQSLADCNNQLFQDSLIKKYLEEKAYRIDYMTPQYQLYCDSVIAICANIDEAWQQKAMPNIKKGSYKNTFNYLEKAVEISPEKWLAYQAFLKAIFTKNYQGAIIDFENSEKIAPGGNVMDHSFIFFQALCYLCLNNYSMSKQLFEVEIKNQEKTLGKKGVHFNTLFYYAILNFKIKNYKTSEVNFRKCLKSYKNHPDANYFYGVLLANNSKRSKAEFYYNMAITSLQQGYTSSEDNVSYVNYPFQITQFEIEGELKKLK